MRDLHPILLSRELGRIQQLRVQWEHTLSVAPEPEAAAEWNPFGLHRELLGLETMEQVLRCPDDDPLKQPLLRWLFLLSERRINHGWYTRTHELYRGQKFGLNAPRKGEFSLAEMLISALSDAPLSAAWFSVLPTHAAALSFERSVHWQRRAELARRFKLPSLDAVELPAEQLEQLAERWLTRTRDLALEFTGKTFASGVESRLGRDASAGWPSHLSESALGDWFRDSDLLRDLNLETGPLPRLIGASSFVRALAQLGRAFVIALAPERQPFVVAQDPYGLEASIFAAMFADLPRELQFLARKLGLSREASVETQRVLARSSFLESRWLALKVVLRPLALTGHESLSKRFAELTHGAVGHALGKELALVLPRLREDDGQRFAACALSELRLHEIQEAHNEDWFRNPRAVDQLRSEAQRPPETRATQEALESGFDAALLRWTRALS